MYVIIRRHLDGPNAILILRIKMILDDVAGDCTLRITVDSINNTAQNINCKKSKMMCLNVVIVLKVLLLTLGLFLINPFTWILTQQPFLGSNET